LFYLLDTNILIDLIKNRPPQVAERIDQLADDDSPAICRHYAVQASALKRQATPIGGNDLWMAAHALALGATLVSHNVREFARIEGLALVDWAAPA
jgi:tRNA(fMet)-specific endonuclease VapC